MNTKPAGQPMTVDAQGAIDLGNVAMPLSGFISEESRQMLREFFKQGGHESLAASSPQEVRRIYDEHWAKPVLARTLTIYPVTITAKMIGGVQTDEVLPAEGISEANNNRVLINLHGGGFLLGARFGGQIEAAPIASLGRIRVITIDYRQFPEAVFPAASEDVEAVYRELLKEYKPENIGIYGASAGGMLSGAAVAWLQKKGLPRPGAIGVFAAGLILGQRGDSDITWLAAAPMGVEPKMAPVRTSEAATVREFGYFKKVDLNDPLISPALHDEVLCKFPPTLVLVSTRDMFLSNAVATHSRLLRVGVQAELYVMEGLGHGAINMFPELAESREGNRVIWQFFDRHLGR